MADMNLVSEINAIPSLIEQLGKAFLDLEANTYAAEDKVLWSDIEHHFCHLETMMVKKYLELEVKEKAFKEKESDFCALLAEREAAVTAKEQEVLDQIQELKDAAVTAIAEVRANHQPASLEPMGVGDSKDGQVSSFLGDSTAVTPAQEEQSPFRTGDNTDGVSGEVKPRPELLQFCEQMDSKGLLNFIMENKKRVSTIREELSVALESVTEPCHLVLASLEGFYPPSDSTLEGDKKDAAFQGMLQSCLIFMEAMATLLARADSGTDHLLNPEIKQQAKAIADEWKPKLADAGIDTANGNSLKIEAFLRLLATFRVASEFDEEELCKLVVAVAHHRQMPELCRSLGLTHKIQGIVEELINGGRQIDAVHFIHAFQLTETFPLVPLLKTYLKDLRRNSQGKEGNLGAAAVEQNAINAQELAALRNVIHCVKNYKLEVNYPLDTLQKRVVQLEKSKSDKKRFSELGRHQHFKKHRANVGFHGSRAPAVSPAAAASASATRQAPTVFGDRGVAYAAGMQEKRYPHPGPSTYDYQTPSQPAYAQQAYDQRSYSYYPQEGRANATPTTYAAAPVNYGNYMGSGPQHHQPYM